MINDGDTVEVYVFHGVSEANQAPLELEFVPNVSDSGVGEESFNETSNPNNQPPTSTFPSNPKTGPSETSSTRFEDPPTIVPPLSPSSTVPPPSPSTVPPPSPSSTVPPPSPSTVTPPSCVPSSDPIIDNDPIDDEVEDESGSEGYNNEDTEQPGLSSRRVINTGIRVTKRADVVTGDIGYTPVRRFKWKGKTTITSTNLERMRAEKVIQTRSAATATTNSQSQTSSSRKTHVPWK
uniref:Membrane protein n=1 Tax=Solanum tuberosum TaxID=4113 RepID=M1DR65_SOLTU